MVNFSAEGCELPSLDFDAVTDWIGRVAASHGFEVGRISYLFVDDETILAANRKHLGHDYYTDIITFDYTVLYPADADHLPSLAQSDAGIENGLKGRIGGDVIISLDTVATNAVTVGQPYERELLRVIIHAVLHLVGIDDKGPGEREVMEAYEDRALTLGRDVAGLKLS